MIITNMNPKGMYGFNTFPEEVAINNCKFFGLINDTPGHFKHWLIYKII